ncbi:uncharacterized protein LOC143246347 isoform X3 [Tachypleus tridentatus]
MLLWGLKARESNSLDQIPYDRYIHVYGHMKDGMTFNISLVPLPGFSTHLHCGYIALPNHTIHPLQDCDLSLPPTEEILPEWTVTCLAGNKLYTVNVTLEEEDFFTYRGNQWEHRHYTRLASFSIGGEKGRGIVEYGERNEVQRPKGQCQVQSQLFGEDLHLNDYTVIPQVLGLTDPLCMSSEVVGGKGMSLAYLMKLSNETPKFHVPNGIVLTTAAFHRHLLEHPELELALSTVWKAISAENVEILKTASASAAEDFLKAPLTEELKDEVSKALKRTFSKDVDELRLAVRSSDVGEDSCETSAAGQMETVLGVRGLSQVYTAISRCWASSVAFNSVQYRRQNGQPVDPRIALVIQEMVPSQVAGVMFTAHPITGHPSYISVSANYGLGESVVSATSEPDTYTLRKSSKGDVCVHEQILGKKEKIFKMTEEGGTKEETVNEQVSGAWCLSKEEVESLGKVGILVESAFGSARDIEWAISEGKIFLLQARPITTEDKPTDYELVHGLDSGMLTENEYLTTANFGEVLPGAASPLCITTAYRLFRTAFMVYFNEKQGWWHPFIPLFTSDMAISHNHGIFVIEETIMKEMDEEDSLISRAWELSMFGRFLEEREQIREKVIHRFGYVPKTVKLKTLLYILMDGIFPGKRLKTVKEENLKFRIPPEDMESAKNLYEYLSFHITDMVEVVLLHVAVSTFSSVMNSLLFGQLIDNYKENVEELLKDMSILISVGKNVESAGIPGQLQELAAEIRKSGFDKSFEAMDCEMALKWLKKDDGIVGTKFREFLSSHGHRCLKEFDTMTKPWNEEPQSLVLTLQAMVKTVHLMVVAKEELPITEAIEQIKYKPTRFSRFVLHFLVSQARRGVCLREMSKSLLVKYVDNLRKGYRLLEKLMVKEGRLPDPELLHFFTNEEIRELLMTRSAHLISTAIRRRRMHKKLNAMVFPEIIIGEPKPITKEEVEDIYSSLQELRGVTVCQGVVKGVAYVAKNLNEASSLQQGDILIVHSTDIAWSPYFPFLSGIVTEIGGLLSHGAVVAREYGLPSLVAVQGATTTFKTDVLLRVKHFLVFLYLLFKRNTLQRRLVDITTDYRQGPVKFGIIASEKERNLENPRYLQKVNHCDEIFFFGVNSAGDCIVLRVIRRKGDEAEVQLHLKHAETNTLYQLPIHPETSVLYREKDVFVAAGIRIKCLNPLRKWRISYNGLLRKITPTGLQAQEEEVHVKFSFIWTVTSLPFDFKIDFFPRLVSEAVACGAWKQGFPSYERITESQDRYDQWGQWKGTVTFEDEDEKEMLLWGLKTRESNSLDQTRYDRYIHIYGHMKDGMTFNISVVPLPGFYTHLRCGYIALPNHTIHPLQDCDLSLLPTEQIWPGWTVTCLAGNKLYPVNVTLEEEDFFTYRGNQWEHRHYTRLASFSIGGEKGRGIVEYGERNEKPRQKEQCQKQIQLFGEDLHLNDYTVIPQVLGLTDPLCMSSEVVGGKGMSLAYLIKLSNDTQKFHVPNGIVLTTAAFRRHLVEHPRLELAISTVRKAISEENTEILKTASASAVEEFINVPLTDELKDKVSKALKRTFSKDIDELRLAVRSSDVGEDSCETSAAGQMETVLGVKGLSQIYSAISQCWASSVAFNSVQYRRQNGQPVDSHMALVIQEMVPSQVAGVMFTAHPVTGHPSYISVSANYGLGESVVSASSEPDTYTLRKSSKGDVCVHEQILGKKETIFKMTEEGGTKEETVKEEISRGWCLSKEEVESLGKVAILVESAFGSARDIEWAISNDKIFLLQARPITTEDKPTDYELVHGLDSGLLTENEYLTIANVGEVLPGATSPLCLTSGYTLFRTAFMLHLHKKQGQWHPFIPLFTSDLIISHNHSMFVIEETVMKEMDEEDSLISRSLELSMFGRFIEEREQIRQKVIHRFGYIPKYLKWKTLLYILVEGFFSEKKLKKEKEKSFNFQIPPEVTKSAKNLYEYLTLHVTDMVEAAILHDVVSMFSSVMNTLLFGHLIDSYKENLEELLKDVATLISVGKNVESAGVPEQLQKLASEICKSGFDKTFEVMDCEKALKWLSKDDGNVGTKFREFLSSHGHRCLKEFDTMTKPWNEEPQCLVKTLQSMVKTVHLMAIAKEELPITEAIEQIKYKPTRFSRFILRFFVSQARRGVCLRERSKSLLVKYVDNFRKGYRLLEKLMVKEGRLPDPELLHFFTNEEIRELLMTRSAHLISTAVRRRRIHKKLDVMMFPEIIVGEPKPITTDEIEDTYSSLQELRGVTICQGVVKGVAHVAKNLDEASSLQQGDILIAHSTDIGWSPYFPLLSGIVTEIGGLISHGAVVAREYGLPSLVAVQGATTTFKTGDVVILDATRGVLKKIQGNKNVEN